MENEASIPLIIVFFSIILFLGVFVGFFVVRFSFKIVNSYKKTEQKRLLKVATQAERHSQRSIARDLHDGLSGRVVGLRFYAQALYEIVQTDEQKDLVKSIELGLAHILEEARNISFNLILPELENRSLHELILNYGKGISKSKEIVFLCPKLEYDIPLDAFQKYHMFRVFQELFSNALVHGHVKRIEVSLKKCEAFIYMYWRDNGSSYDFLDEAKRSEGIGMKSIVSRIKQVDGSLDQIPTDTGNLFRIKMPISL